MHTIPAPAGIRVADLAFGCGPTSGAITGDDSELQLSLVAAALDAGIDHFDTAPIYADGSSERNLAATLTTLNAQPKISSKVFYQQVDEEFDKDIESGFAHESVRGSLARLGRDRLDMLFVHNRISLTASVPRARRGPGPEISLDEFARPDGILRRLRAVKSDGLTGAIGLTGMGSDHEAMLRTVRSGLVDTLTYDINIGSVSRALSADGVGMLDVVAEAVQLGLPIYAIRVLAKTTFIGELPDWADLIAAYPGVEDVGVVPTYDLWRVCAERKFTLSQFATAFVLALPWVHAAIGGFSTHEHLEQALASRALVHELAGSPR